MGSELDRNWIIVGGSPRSGTTLLNLLLNSHDNIYLTNEHNLIDVIDKIANIYYKEKVHNEKFIHFERKKGAKETWKNSDILEQTLQRKYSLVKILNILYVENAKALGKNNLQVLGDKLPRYYFFDFKKFTNTFNQELKIIHISRNPLDVINSMIVRHNNKMLGKDTWKLTSNLEEALNEWIYAWNYIVSNEETEILHIKYEDLCLFNKTLVIKKISDFLNVKNDFDFNVIQSEPEKHFQRQALNNENLIKIKNHLGDIIYEWDENNLDYLKQKYGQYKILEIPVKKESLINKILSIGKKNT